MAFARIQSDDISAALDEYIQQYLILDRIGRVNNNEKPNDTKKRREKRKNYSCHIQSP